jgi:hypothetical protein
MKCYCGKPIKNNYIPQTCSDQCWHYLMNIPDMGEMSLSRLPKDDYEWYEKAIESNKRLDRREDNVVYPLQSVQY